jgi:DNA-binding CsgD family transcriptional regulator
LVGIGPPAYTRGELSRQFLRFGGRYKLTPTELRVLLAIFEVGGVPEVAEALGVADSTVKTHIGRLFAKTGTSRQADLVKIVAGFAGPLIG